MFTILNILHLLWHVGLALAGGVCGAKIVDKLKRKRHYECHCEKCEAEGKKKA